MKSFNGFGNNTQESSCGKDWKKYDSYDGEF